MGRALAFADFSAAADFAIGRTEALPIALTGALGAGSEMALARGGSATSATAGAAAAAGPEAVVVRGATLPAIATGATLVLPAGGAVDSIVPTSGRRGVLSAVSGDCGRRETGRGTAETLGLEVAGDVAASATASAPPDSAGIDAAAGSAAGGELALAETAAGGATDLAEPVPLPDAATLASGGDDATGSDEAATAGATLGETAVAFGLDGGFDACVAPPTGKTIGASLGAWFTR